METILEKVPFYLTILSTVCGGVTIALFGGITIWTFRDIRARSRDFLAQILATLLVIVLPIVGLVVYLMLRPRETLADAYERSLEQEALLQAIEEPEICPGCGQRVKSDYLYCPACHTRLKRACSACNHPIYLSWSLCPYCGASVTPQALEPAPISKQEPAPTEEATSET
ncbi:MAG: zinc ribbon domain-containing protein [Chloroflexota bacterium]|nr:zinc ribbon domain-containing protein [Chloroflexota bacterium]